MLLNHTYTYSWDNTRRLENIEAEVQHLREQLNDMHQLLVRGDSQSTSMTITGPFWELFDAQTDLQAFVPEQFVSEWDFPGLNLFYFPSAWQGFFGGFSLAI